MSKAKALDNRNKLGLAALILPFTALVPSYAAVLLFPGTKTYSTLLSLAILLGIILPLLGLVLAWMSRKSKLGKVALIVNLLITGYNIYWISVLPQTLDRMRPPF